MPRMSTRLLRYIVSEITQLYLLTHFTMYFIGVDVSKDKLNAACINIQGEVIFETEAINNILGFRKILSLLEKHAGSDPHRIGFESTGIYHLKFLKFCLDNRLNAFIINPVLSAQAVRLSVRPRKTDKIDAVLIAQLVMNGKGRLIASYDLPQGRKAILNAIDQYQQCLQKLKGHLRNMQAEDPVVLATVQHSMEDSIKRMTDEVKALKKMLDSMSTRETELLCSLVGISTFSAHKIFDQIGSIDRFARGEQLVAFSGLEPKPIQSGSSINHRGKITKRGSRKLRHIIYQCANIARMHDRELKEFFDKRRSGGLHYTAAVCAVGRKMLLRIYAVLKRGTPYIPQKVLTC